MSGIDWSKAPEGATHAAAGGWRCWADCWYKLDAEGNWFAYLMHQEDVWDKNSGPGGREDLAKRPSPAWNGEGLPPVGIECERALSPTVRKITTICGHSTDGAYASFYDGDGLMGWGDDCKFFPLRTLGQIAEDERNKACDRMYGVILDNVPEDRRKNGSDIVEALYDAGLRFSEQPK